METRGMWMKRIAVIGLLLGAFACGDEDESPAAVEITALTLTAGPSWVPDLPPEQQDLQGHNDFLVERFEAGALIANGPLASGLGLYLYALDDVAGIIDVDPGIVTGVLSLANTRSWTVESEQFSAARDDLSWFLLEVEAPPPTAWQAWLETPAFRSALRLVARTESRGHVILQTNDDVAARAIADSYREPAAVTLTAWFPQRTRSL